MRYLLDGYVYNALSRRGPGPHVDKERVRAAAVRLAAITRRQALDDQHMLSHARVHQPELVPALGPLCARRG